MHKGIIMRMESKYQILKVIGKGACGTAFLAKRIADGMQVVCKRINLKNLSEKEQAEAET